VKRAKTGFTLIELMIVISIISILMLILLPNMVRMRAEARMQGCCTNLRYLASALESYSVENGTRYPTQLAGVAPKYISVIPTCMSSGTNTCYTAGFTSQSNPDAYTIVCKGSWHVNLRVPPDYPQWTSASALKSRPGPGN
jgi:prepilin-type N-terminal cleavage/methylation domain-containing protein